MTQEAGSIGDRAKAVIHEGNVRRVVVSKDGQVYVDLPLTLVIVGCALAPWLAALGLVVAVIRGAKMEVVRPVDAGEAPAVPAAGPGEGSEPVVPPD